MCFGALLLFMVASNLFLSDIAFADWTLACYNEQLKLICENGAKIIVHEAHFGYLQRDSGGLLINNSCESDYMVECWMDVTAPVSRLCSGLESCSSYVHYSVDLSHESFSKKCAAGGELSSKPSLLVESDCISSTLFTQISSSSRVDLEQVGGYLTTMDYTETRHAGAEWRSHLAEAVCQPGMEQLPYRFYLPAPSTQIRPTYGQEDSVAFVVRIKDIALTYPSPTSDPIGSTRNRRMRLADDLECVGPGRPCQQDYLEISIKLPSSSLPPGSMNLLPVTRICLVDATNQTEAQSVKQEAQITGRTFGPLTSAVGLQFKSNLNLLNPHVIAGKGILIEYIALFCTPINPPSGYGEVNYRFRPLPHPAQTIAYAEILCPANRWLEPQRTMTTDDSRPWWLERQRHTVRFCDHLSRTWSPDGIPEACLTETELDAFVAKIQSGFPSTSVDELVLPPPHPEDDSASDRQLSPLSESQTRLDPPGINKTAHSDNHGTPSQVLPPIVPAEHESTHQEQGLPSGTSIAVGAVLGFFICLLAVVLIVYSLRYRLIAQYQKTTSYPSVPERLTRSSSSFNPSIRGYHPMYSSMDWRRKLNKSKWDLFKPWRVPVWSQNLSGTYPDLPRQTLVQGSFSGFCHTPETMVLDRSHMMWRTQMHRSGASSYSLVPGGTSPAGGLDNGGLANSSPWLRTNSTTRLVMRPQYFASFSELTSPVDGHQQLPRSSWLPWRRSFRKQRRLYTQLQRRKEALYQSQRRLMESNGMSHSSTMQFAPTISSAPGLSLPTITPHLPSLITTGGYLPSPTRPLSHDTSHSYKTLTTSEGASPSGMVFETGGATMYPVVNGQLHYPGDKVELSTRCPLYNPTGNGFQYVDKKPIAEDGTSEPLPWKTESQGSSLSQSFKRLSSFLRNRNSPLTPPRSVRQPQQLHPQSMSTLNTAHYSPTDANQSGRSIGQLPEFQTVAASPRTRSESGSVRFSGSSLIRSLFNIPTPKISDPTASTYHLDTDNTSILNDPVSSSMTTRGSRVGSVAAASPIWGPDYWSQYPEFSQVTASTVSTIRPHSPPVPLPPTSINLLRPNWTSVPPHQGNVDFPQLMDPRLQIPHSNDPYLIPASEKRLRGAALRCEEPKGQNNASGGQHEPNMPSGTSSAVSSLVFADSAEDELEVSEATTNPRPHRISGVQVTAVPSPGQTDEHHERKPVPANREWTKDMMDYVTYDETRSFSGNLAEDDAAQRTLMEIEGPLIATQVGELPDAIGPCSEGKMDQLKRKRSRKKDQIDSRPLSEAMISNHYYVGNEVSANYPEPSEPAPVLRPAFSHAGAPTSMSPKPHPPLPPLWRRPSTASSPTKATRPFSSIGRDEYGSIDSLYETVDQVKVNGTQTDIKLSTRTAICSSRILTPITQETQLERQKLALPPTPDSSESLRAPVASSDEETEDDLLNK
ncbi:unnamed protein product [Dicrocoelium dendriticum]|nr:unnamed protein product [Dicrocoelium dendriticum]